MSYSPPTVALVTYCNWLPRKKQFSHWNGHPKTTTLYSPSIATRVTYLRPSSGIWAMMSGEEKMGSR